MADDQMPREARRKGGADTLFSAEWFDDADDFAKVAKGEDPSTPAPAATAAAPKAPPAAEAPASGGPSKALIALVLLVVFLGGGCLASAMMVGGAWALGLFGG